MNTDAVRWPLTIYYDRSCPLCAHEMHALVAHDRFSRVRLIDSSVEDFHDAEAAAAGVSAAQMSTLIHARDAAGVWFRGVDVFVLAYQAVGLAQIARLWSWPRLRPLWDRLYPWVARNRMQLSRFGLPRAYGWIVGLAAARAAKRSRSCADAGCSLPPAD